MKTPPRRGFSLEERDAVKPGVHIVDFEPGQLKELVRMWRESFESALRIVDPHTLEEQEEYFSTVVAPRSRVRVALEGGEIAGFIAATPDSILQLYVRNGYHRRGIGSALLQWAKAQSGGALWLYTFERNSVARAFYERHGFTIVARGFEPTWQLADLKYQWADAPRDA